MNENIDYDKIGKRSIEYLITKNLSDKFNIENKTFNKVVMKDLVITISEAIRYGIVMGILSSYENDLEIKDFETFLALVQKNERLMDLEIDFSKIKLN